MTPLLVVFSGALLVVFGIRLARQWLANRQPFAPVVLTRAVPERPAPTDTGPR
jgi:hypothetical protein